MSILDDFRELGKFQKHKNKERNLEKSLISRTIRDSNFKKRYDSFLEAMIRDLTIKFNEERLSEVHYKPLKASDGRFFEMAREDERMSELYEITPKNDGSYSFLLKDVDFLDDLLDSEYDEDEDDW